MSTFWKAVLVFLVMLIIAQAWKIYELENRPCVPEKIEAPKKVK